MLSPHYFLLLSTVGIILMKAEGSGSCHDKIRPFLKYCELLAYDNEALHHNHQRAKRATEEEEMMIYLELFAYNRKFDLMLKPDTSIFADDFEVVSNDTTVLMDISFIYSGKLRDENGSYCHGSVINGHFEGFIQTKNGTFYVEYEKNTSNDSADSYIYHESDIDYTLMQDEKSFNLTLRMYQLLGKMKMKAKKESVIRAKRSLDLSRTTCMLHLTADHLFYKRFGSIQAVISQIAGYMRSVNTMYDAIDFNGIKHINFKVKNVTIIQEDESSSAFIGPEKLLMEHSETSWNKYCLSYLLTNRDYSGVLGVAWNGRSGNDGGICSKFSKNPDNPETDASLNTGIITIQKYGQYLPPRLIHITLAHEFGHSLGSPHDGGEECTQITSENSKGNYLMFPYATDGNQYNNDKFSPCSVNAIEKILRIKKDQCFVESGHPICGNQIVDVGEECDVGFDNNNPCCYSASAAKQLQCTLKPGKQCSPSQGLCCGQDCYYKTEGESCQPEGECTYENHCTGASAKCPKPLAKSNDTLCNFGTRICLNGMCQLSICAKFDLEQCDCESNSMYEMCQLCCQKPGRPDTCKSTTSVELAYFFNKTLIQLPPGAPCGQRQGYCDMFHFCRFVDADGPIARLKNSFLNLIELEDTASWMKARWWIILIIILTVAAMMAGTVFIFGRTLDSDKGKKELLKARCARTQRHVNTELSVNMQRDLVYWQTEQLHVASAYLQYETKM
ncbi:disintegrin and metalloproteinase domain-containing protein 10-like [Discoglossus pictus]